MCVICFKNSDATITEDELQRMWAANSDGAGYSFVADKKLYTRKGFMRYSKFINRWNKDIKDFNILSVPLMVHFRIGSHGGITSGNCHPFVVSDKVAFAHNGMLYGLGATNGYGKSDTALFADIIRKLPQNWFDVEKIRQTIASYAAPGSKLCFLTADNKYFIANEDKGTWDGQRWFSNMLWKARIVSPILFESNQTKKGIETGAVESGVHDLAMKCDWCCGEFFPEDLELVGNARFCSECLSSMTDEEYLLIKEFYPTKEHVRTLTKDDAGKADEMIECPQCKVMNQADDGMCFCEVCSMSYDEKGQVLNY